MSQWDKSEPGSAAYTVRKNPLHFDEEVLARMEAICGPEAVRRMVEESPYAEVHRRVGDEVKVTTCCCKMPGATADDCRMASGNKTPCRCNCHSRRIWKAKR